MDQDARLASARADALAVARRFVRDANAAEDLAQLAMMRALARGPALDRRAWLATLVRNLARDAATGERARARRQGIAAARRATVPDGRGARVPIDDADPVRRHEARELALDLARALASLSEPYRTTVRLRYELDLPPAAIAPRCGVPLDTVKTRLRRGLALLRAGLEREGAGPPRGAPS